MTNAAMTNERLRLELDRRGVRLRAIVAMSRNLVIGRDGGLPWRLPDDLKRFKERTGGHAVVMGRGTVNELGGKALPGRRNILLSRSIDEAPEGFELFRTLPDAVLAAAETDRTPWIVGGGEVYRQSLDLLDEIEATEVDAEVDGDTTFPDIRTSDRWRGEVLETHPPDDRHTYGFRVVRYVRTDRG